MLTSHLLVCYILAAGSYALPEVTVHGTAITGRNVLSNVEFFGGIPYAEPPLGALRLRPPVLKVRLNTTAYNGSDYGKACIQPPLTADAEFQSEDCLTVNIHRPVGMKPSAKLPVLFWTYGGGFIIGSSNLYDGSSLVQRSIERGTPIIYVNFNYRLGPLGFPQGQEADDRRVLNLGLKDQIAALEWAQANIRFFGGDKDKVTIFGESAGAMMTGVLLLNPSLESLARGAILESGASNGPSALTAARNERPWQDFVAKVPSCARLSTSGNALPCLQNASTEEITRAVLEAITFTELHLASILEDGSRIPFIAGTNRDEGTGFASQLPLTDEVLKEMLIGAHASPGGSPTALEAATNRILELYPADPAVGSPYGTGDELFGLPVSYKRHASILGDISFDAPRRMMSQAAARFGVKTYGYHFTDPQPIPSLGVSHGSEVAYVFGQVPPAAGAASQNLSVTMMDYWISFTDSLDPNDEKGGKRPRWPQYKADDQVLLKLEGGNTTVIQDDFRKEQIAFLNDNAGTLHR